MEELQCKYAAATKMQRRCCKPNTANEINLGNYPLKKNSWKFADHIQKRVFQSVQGNT